eukprot:TRINITY_DN6372_c0_g1_i1.p1 TRINITY_DN6372_c0_g1~~TRINITY_DN6372_c0_g1_i1.p1  ORF type:complete len:223 (-),score=33.77 TRINITY_DN6372_c0_g1_i1:38-706(-)
MKYARTTEGKPYLSNKVGQFRCFNFNVSHAGEYVVIASHPDCVVGVDVMEVDLPNKKETIDDFFSTMEYCFTKYEWINIKAGSTGAGVRAHTSDKRRLDQFFRHWCLKEAYIKAIGIGLGLELQRAQFTIDNDNNTATIAIDGIPQPQWSFVITYLEHIPGMEPASGLEYIVATCIGPPADVIPSYYEAVIRPSISAEAVTQNLPIHNSYSILTPEKLVRRE